jgi:hypothetical protein
MLITWNSISNKTLGTSFSDPSFKETLSQNPPERIPRAMKRRLTPLGRLVIETLYGAVDFIEASSLNSEIPWVVSSRHGDGSRVERLLTDISKNELLSPMDFSQSVHNAIAGAFSIVSQNTQMHTAISAGQFSFEMGILEAYALQKKTNGYVGYTYYDEPMPSQYDDIIQGNKGKAPFCLAMILGPDSDLLNKPQNAISLTHLSKPLENSEMIAPLQSITRFLYNNKPNLYFYVSGGHFEIRRYVT